MKGSTGLLLGLGAGVGLGVVLALVFVASMKPEGMKAASNDRYEDYVMVTGAVNISPKLQTDGVWMLDYKSGKLLGTVVDKALGKIVGWAEVDLVAEFEVAPKQDVHFLMTTGWVSAGQSALYIAETTTGKFGVYTMGPAPQGTGIVIRRHDLTSFRSAKPADVGVAVPAGPAAAPVVAAPMALPMALPMGGLPPVAEPAPAVIEKKK